MQIYKNMSVNDEGYQGLVHACFGKSPTNFLSQMVGGITKNFKKQN